MSKRRFIFVDTLSAKSCISEYWKKGNIFGWFGRQLSGQPMIFPFVQYSLIFNIHLYMIWHSVCLWTFLVCMICIHNFELLFSKKEYLVNIDMFESDWILSNLNYNPFCNMFFWTFKNDNNFVFICRRWQFSKVKLSMEPANFWLILTATSVILTTTTTTTASSR